MNTKPIVLCISGIRKTAVVLQHKENFKCLSLKQTQTFYTSQ